MTTSAFVIHSLASPTNPSMSFHQRFTPLVLYLFLFSSVLSAASTVSENFIQCLTENSYTSMSSVVYSPSNSSFESIFEFSALNYLFTTPENRRPSFIITPRHESHIQAAVICSKRQGFLLRLRGGGHDYEGISYSAPKPFVMVDFINFRDIKVDIKSNSAWAQAGATTGEIYYSIAQKSNTHGFPAGIGTTLGIAGHIAGGGLGYLWRKYGLSADNVLDALFIDVNGKLHDRKSMGEDLFWALRGSGADSFGVIVAWKLRLVRVPPIVTVFRVPRTLEQNGTSLFYKWQNIAPKLTRDIYLGTFVNNIQGETNRTLVISFESTYLGRLKELLPIMEKNFPELGLTAEDCIEMSWVRSTMFNFYMPLDAPTEQLLNRSYSPKSFSKGRVDFVQKAIPMEALEGLWKEMLEGGTVSTMSGETMGGIINEISETAIPYPHRKGNMYVIRYATNWEDDSETAKNMEVSTRIYNYMAPYVSKSPRRAYYNYKDYYFGFNQNANTPYSEARLWGEHYFLGNFERLAKVKSKVDPENFFWNQVSIPPYAPTCVLKLVTA